MKLHGKKIEGPNVEIIVIPRAGEREDIILKAQAVLDYDDFDKACPRPEPPVIMRKGGVRQSNPEDPRFKAALDDYNEKRMNWMIIKSLQATEGLEWENITLEDPNSWTNLEDEMKASGLSQIECGRIRAGVFAANCLDESKLDEARASFLASLQQPLDQSFFLKDEPNDTPSGVVANVSASVPPASEESGTSATSGFKPAS